MAQTGSSDSVLTGVRHRGRLGLLYAHLRWSNFLPCKRPFAQKKQKTNLVLLSPTVRGLSLFPHSNGFPMKFVVQPFLGVLRSPVAPRERE
jgi:hypothetical protein